MLPPFEANLKKRLVRAPKVYLHDSGILHALLEIEDFDHLLAHPQVGESWEGFIIEQLLAVIPRWRPAFLRTSNGAEVDLVLERGEQRLIFEIKLSEAPQPSRGFHTLVGELQPEAATITAPIETPFEWRRGIWVMDLVAAIARWGEE